MDSKNQSNRLETGNVGKLLFSLAMPSIIAQLVNILYNIVDRIYIGRMENGTAAMSAISVALPIVTFITAVTALLGAGGAPLAAIRMGQRNREEAEKIMTNSFVALITSGFFLTIIIEIFQIPLLHTFGADANNLHLASQYITIYGVGTIFVQIAFGMNPYINTQGFAVLGMVTVLIGAILNIVLDPLLIFTFDMGIRGAAIATILSQFVSAVWALNFLFSKKSAICIRRKYFIPDFRVLGSICALGVSPFIMNSTESLLQIVFNNQLSLYGGTLAVGTMSILQSMIQVVFLFLMGLSQGAQPIMSFNFGAGNMERVRATFRILFTSCLSISVLGVGTIIVFSSSVAKVFTSDPDLIRMGIWGLKVYLLGSTIFGAQIACQQSFVALGQAKQSMMMALLRKIVLLIPLIFVLPYIIGDSSFAIQLSRPIADIVCDPGRVFAVFFAETISDALAAITTSVVFFKFYRKVLANTLRH